MNLLITGVEASYKLTEHDLKRMEQYKNIIMDVGRAYSMDPAVIAAIISRESRAGATLIDGWGDHGNDYGLMQIDKRYHKLREAWNSKEHVAQVTEIWPKEHQFKGGISAYNAGVRNVRIANDYANDVVARAQRFKHRDIYYNA